MRITNINYPHPVLDASNSDYIDSSFDIALETDPTVTDSSILIDVQIDRYLCGGIFQESFPSYRRRNGERKRSRRAQESRISSNVMKTNESIPSPPQISGNVF